MNNNYNPYFNYSTYPNMNNFDTRFIPNTSYINNVNPGMFTRGPAATATRAPGILSSLFGGSSPVAGASGIASATKTFSFGGLLNGASKTLGVINQAIPVVYQIKPIWNNAKTMFNVAKAINSKDSDTKTNNTSSTTNTNQQPSINKANTTKKYIEKSIHETGPTFFA